jgi:hypothetical protein
VRRGFRAVRRFTCPNHPEGPPTLPAGGYEREELQLDEAFGPGEVRALRVVVAAARICELESDADTVEAMFGLCCRGHRWKIVGFRATTHAEESISSFMEIFRHMPIMPPGDHVLLNELARGDYKLEVKPGHPLPVRIPLVRGGEDTSTDG